MAGSREVMLLAFEDAERCRDAFDEAVGMHGVRQAALLERSADGELDIPESHVRGAGAPTVGGGVVGGLVGLLGGPLGALIGAAAGAAIANAAEDRAIEESGAGLIVLSSRVREGESLLVLDVHDAASDAGAVEELAERFGVGVERIPEEDFQAEVRRAEEAAEG